MPRPRADVIRLLIVDRSPAERASDSAVFDDVPDIDVVGEAGTVEKALRLLERDHPHRGAGGLRTARTRAVSPRCAR